MRRQEWHKTPLGSTSREGLGEQGPLCQKTCPRLLIHLTLTTHLLCGP